MNLSNYRSIEALMDSDLPEPILRIDFFLHAVITGTECELEPTTHAEELLYSLATGDESRLEFIEPRTILDTYLHALQNGDTSDLPKPRTASEMLLYQAVTGEDLGVKPVSRMDKYLSVLQKAGGLDYILSTSDDVSIIPLPNSTSGTAMIGEICGNHAITNNVIEQGLHKETLSFVGTSKNNTVDVTVEGINLFDNSIYKFSKGAFVNGTGAIKPSEIDMVCEDYIPIEVLKDYNHYTMYTNHKSTWIKIFFYDNNLTFCGGISGSLDPTSTFVLSNYSSAKYFRVGFYNINGETDSKLCIVATSNFTTVDNYADYGKTNKTITLPSELRSVSDDRYDRIIYKENDGTYFEQNIRKLTLNGSESWTAYALSNDFPDVVGFYCRPGNIHCSGIGSKTNYVISSDINTVSEDVFPGYLTRNEEILCLGYNSSEIATGNHYVKLSIRKDKLSEFNVNGLKAYLKENPITIYFKAHTPTITKISDMKFKCSNNVTLHLDYGTVKPSKVVIRYPYKQPTARFRMK